MSKLIVDPAELPLLAEAATAGNFRLRQRLLGMPAREADARVRAIAEVVAQAIDCTRCANCCKTLEPELAEEEMEQLQKIMGGGQEDKNEHLGYDSGRALHYLKSPCPFLLNNRCTVYASRPGSCRDYPRLVPDFKFRWRKTMADYKICPIVFNTIERLKESLGDGEP